jgi:hypothetical protein
MDGSSRELISPLQANCHQSWLVGQVTIGNRHSRSSLHADQDEDTPTPRKTHVALCGKYNQRSIGQHDTQKLRRHIVQRDDRLSWAPAGMLSIYIAF